MSQVLPFYLYGTARIGEPLHDLVESIVTNPPALAMAPGTELLVSPVGSYPYLVSRRPASDPFTWGDLVLLRRSEDLRNLVNMELAVGYSLEAVRVEHDLPGVGPFALAFVWRRAVDRLQPLGSPSWLDRATPLGRVS